MSINSSRVRVSDEEAAPLLGPKPSGRRLSVGCARAEANTDLPKSSGAGAAAASSSSQTRRRLHFCTDPDCVAYEKPHTRCRHPVRDDDGDDDGKARRRRRPKRPRRVVESVSAALLGCVTAAVGGLSIASSMFPAGTAKRFPQFYSAGLFWGLFCGAIANWTLLAMTRLPCGVGGTLLPAIIVVKNYAESQIGPSEPTTVLMAYALSTAIFGAVAFALGRAHVLRAAFKLVPFPVLLGFLTSVGVSMFASALGPAVPDPSRNATTGGFVSLTDGASWRNLARPGAPEKWVPGVAAAVIVFALQRQPSLAAGARYLAPAVAVTMIVVVNCVPGAKEHGWLAPVREGATPADMFRLWPWAHLGASSDVNSGGGGGGGGGEATRIPPVNWELLWGGGLFAMTVAEAVVIGLLAMLEDLAMVHKATAIADPAGAGAVDSDWEVQLQGVMNLAASVLCGLPASLVGSYSFAALKFGGGGVVFYAAQACGSTVFLVLATRIVEALPNMVPCFILFWVALQMASWGLWDMRPQGVFDFGAERTGALDAFEWALVWVMAIVSLDPIGWVDPTMGFNAVDKSGTLIFVTMMFLGVFFAFVNTVRLFRCMPSMQLEGDVATVRSDVLRTSADDQLLSVEGRRVLVLRFARAVVSFHNVGQLEKAVETLVERRTAELRADREDGHDGGRVVAIVLDVSLVQGFSVDAGQMFLEMLPLAARHGFRIVVCGASAAVFRRLILYGAPLRMVSVTLEFLAEGEATAADAVWATCERLNCVLERFETALLAEDRQRHGGVHSSGVAEAERLAAARAEVERVLPRLARHAVQPLLAEVHSKLSKYTLGASPGVGASGSDGDKAEGVYDVALLEQLANHVEVRTLAEGEAVYSFTPEEHERMGKHMCLLSMSGFGDFPTPPLVWVLRGAVEHRFTGGEWRSSLEHVSRIADTYMLREISGEDTLPRLERAEVSDPAAGLVIGPLQTHAGFDGMMVHFGSIRAVAPGDSECLASESGKAAAGSGVGAAAAVVAVLTRRSFDELRRANPECANLLHIYLARKRFFATGTRVSSVRTPKLLI